MRKILTSILVLGITSAIVVGLSSAFFSDTETSSGNVLQAGAIDLKVDHVFASYNDEECQGDCTPTGDNLIINGSFEEPVVSTPQDWNVFPHTSVNGWSADWITTGGEGQPTEANIELHAGVNGWNPQDGDQYTELDSDWDGPNGGINNEAALIRLYQDIPTTTGEKYELRYWHSYRPGENAANNEMRILVDGTVINFIDSANGSGETQTNWIEYTHQFTATDSTTTIEFVGEGPNNSLGIFLDNVSVHLLDCQTQIGELACRLWEEKDLEEGDFFWNFNDVKPGDHGRNVFSLHVYDNDAYSCLISDFDDQENGVTDPETEAGDPGEPDGEVLDHLEIFLWQENGAHDGIYNPGTDTPLYTDSFFDITIDISVPPADPLTASTTYYYGFAWCLGNLEVDGDGNITCDGSGNFNDAQTDTLSVDMNFYAEQARNNDDFSCANLISPTPTPEQ